MRARLAALAVALSLLAAPAARADPPSPAAAALQAALDAAIAAGAPSFALPAGEVFFNGANFNVSGAGAMPAPRRRPRRCFSSSPASASP